ncbi:MAG: alpha/beta hydrolase [Acidimicrobiia bacterium]|jgi:pimeloyl-ACP methyl ester carboxylesterase|nr:alpha/beta hydrolase [Acidimicrobiia bacterium]
MDARVDYDEFGYLHENAAEFGLAYDGPPLVRRESVEVAPGRRLSALVWGDAPPDVVLIHGGAQNAHTWDTVALALGRPLVAVDLPGHGHSDAARSEREGLSAPERHALDIAVAVELLAPEAQAVVGMSLGGLTSIVLAGQAPELVRSLVLVDVTPGVTGDKAKEILDFVNGPARFASFEELLARTIEFNPTRTESSLRRGILHNAMQEDDGSWVWRYRRHDAEAPFEMARDADAGKSQPIVPPHLWETFGALEVPVMLVRGMRQQSVVDDADEAELRRRLPGARIEHVAEAGHSVQGDAPLELAALLDDFIA